MIVDGHPADARPIGDFGYGGVGRPNRAVKVDDRFNDATACFSLLSGALPLSIPAFCLGHKSVR
jgi:hypothetical protein